MFYPCGSILLLLAVALVASTSATRRNAFLLDYFSNKPFMLTINVCWEHSETTKFLRQTVASGHAGPIAIYRNLTTPNSFLAHLSNNNHFVLDMRDECTSSWKILEYINATLAFRFPLKFLLLVDGELDARLTDVLRNYAILTSTDMTIAMEVSDAADFQLWQPYKIDMDHSITWEKYGTWNETFGVYSYINLTEMPTRRHDFQKTGVKVTFQIGFNSTLDHLEDFRQPRVDTFTKQNFGAIKALMEYCNISLIIVRSKDNGYFNQTTREWSGMIHKLYQREVALAGSSAYFTIERFQVVDFIKMQNSMDIKFFMKKPPLSYMFNVYILPFQSNVWKALLVIILLFFSAMYLILNWETKKVQQINRRDKFTPSDVSLIMCEAICQQGSTMDFRTVTGRILELFMYLAFFFLYSSYSAYIVVILQSTHAIADYQELYHSSMGVGGMDTYYMLTHFTWTKNALKQKLYEKKIGPKGFYTLEDGIKKVQHGCFAFHAEVPASYNYIAKTFTDDDVCNLQIMEGYNSYYKGYTAIPKNSPYKEIFKVGLMKIDEYGIQSRNIERYAVPPKCHGGGGSFGSVGIRDMYNALLILAVGMALAVGVLLLECLFHYRRTRRLQSW